MTQRRVTDTAKQARETPGLLLAQAIAHGTSGAIENMEAQGQEELVASEVIPSDFRKFGEADLTALGFVLGPPDPNDPMFRPATFPEGWSVKPTDHSMWSHVVDAKGRQRFSIFYKAAYYDRHAHMLANSRFGYTAYADGSAKGRYAAVITDGGLVVATLGERASEDYERGDELQKQCVAWLDERHPDWRNPFAYWD